MKMTGTTTRIDNQSLSRFIGPHQHVVLSCHADIPQQHLFLFLRLMGELNAMGSDESEFHVFYIDIDDSTGIPTPQVECVGKRVDAFDELAGRYEGLYR